MPVIITSVLSYYMYMYMYRYLCVFRKIATKSSRLCFLKLISREQEAIRVVVEYDTLIELKYLARVSLSRSEAVATLALYHSCRM